MVAVVARADQQVGQDPAVPRDAPQAPHGGRRGGGRGGSLGGSLGCLLLNGAEGGRGGHGVAVLLPGEVLQGGGLLLLLKSKVKFARSCTW